MREIEEEGEEERNGGEVARGRKKVIEGGIDEGGEEGGGIV